jgi:hypothetical protein
MNENIEIDGFPQDEDTTRMLYWMGNDYVSYILNELFDGLRKQDLGTRLLAVKCEGQPDFLSAWKKHPTKDDVRLVSRMEVTFDLQLLVEDSRQMRWRLYVKVVYRAENLDMPESSKVRGSFNIIKAEAA